MQRLVLLTVLFQAATALVILNNNRNSTQHFKENGQESDQEAMQHKPSKEAIEHKRSQEVSEPARPVFFAVIMGRLAFRHQVSLWLSSLRKLGKWQGVAVIVSDRPTCLAKTLGEVNLLGELLSSSEQVDIYGPVAGAIGNLHIVKRPIAKSINHMKLEKARAWLNVKKAEIPFPVSFIVYTDEDVVITKSVSSFMMECRKLARDSHTLALFRDTGKSMGELHTGVVVIFDSVGSDQCLQAWGKNLIGSPIESAIDAPGTKKLPSFDSLDAEEEALNEDNNVEADVSVFKEGQLLEAEMAAMGPDQRALGRTKACKRSATHNGINILPEEFFWLPTPAGLKSSKSPSHTFVHFTNTGRWKTISHDVIRAYLTHIGIPRNIDPLGKVKDLQCAVPEGEDASTYVVNKGPSNYKK